MRIETTSEELNSIPPRHKWKLLDFLDLQECVTYDYHDDGITIKVETARDSKVN